MARSCRWLLAGAVSSQPLLVAAQQAAVPPEPAASEPEPQRILIRGQRPIDIGPLPGLAITKEQIPANVQSATKEQIKESRAINLGDYMNTQLQGVSVNDYSGNPFQMDVNYRGFTASPQVGTPQGLSVFFDGVRVNEPFGDVVNWDLIPLNAIERFDLFPGSNPIFGLNTLGGAIAVHSKSGFSAPGVEASVLGGSWGRKQLQLSGGINEDGMAGFAALNLFDEDGWRDDSPSRVRQFYARGDMSVPSGLVTATILASNNDLVGNGLIPIELYRERPETVFTSPDETKNKLWQFTLAGAFDVSDTMNVTSRAYRRKSDRNGLNGDVYEDFQEFGVKDTVTPFRRLPPTLPICQYAINGNGGVDTAHQTPLNGPLGTNCQFVQYAPTPYQGQRRNGGFLTANGTRQEPGVVDGGTPIGLLTKTDLDQTTDGLGAQFNWNLEEHKFMVGASVDRSRADYLMSQRLGLIDADHRTYSSPDDIAPQFVAAFTDIVGNSFDGKETTSSVYFSELWSPRTDLHLTLAGRYNHTRTKSNLGTRSRAFSDVGEVNGALPIFIACPSSDPASCPDEPQPLVNPTALQLTPTKESFTYDSFNPSLGASWMATSELNFYGNVSRGSRVPSVVELGCALDATPTPIDPAHPQFGSVPRSLLGAACTLPTTLSGDPYLPQIRSTSGELGVRGRLAEHWEWNASAYRTDLKDDIYSVGVGSGQSYFDTVGKTRRQGFELGFRGSAGPFDVSANYAYVEATFESTFYVLSPYNSSADFDQNSRNFVGDAFGGIGFGPTNTQLLPSATANANRGFGTFLSTRVDPGARLPGIPAHNLNATMNWQAADELRLGLTFVAHSRSYVRGNENNQHKPGGTDQQIGQYECVKGTGCPIDGYFQFTVPAGRPFTDDGQVPGFGVFNLNASYEIAKHLTLNLLVTNLFDRDYATAGRLGINPFAPSTIGAIGPSGWNYNSAEWQNTTFVGPGSPRAFWLSLDYAFDDHK